MININKVILFSHGFGIQKDNLGLFTFLSEKFQSLGYKTVLFDYYEYDSSTQEVFTIPFSKQAEILQKQIENVKSENPADEIILVCHSQGSIVPALCDVTSISKTVGVSPFFLTDEKTVYERYAAREGSTTNFNDISRRKHSDGKITVIPPQYWQERFSTNQYDLYNSLSKKTDLTLIYGTDDSILNAIDLEKIVGPKLIKTESDHDFKGENKEILYKILVDIV